MARAAAFYEVKSRNIGSAIGIYLTCYCSTITLRNMKSIWHLS
jgi:hypothetical protein